MADFKKLEVWRKAHELALSTSEIADSMRGAAHTSLRSQMIRAAGSIDSNIIEGRGQRSEREFARYLNIAINSANELEGHFMMAHDLGVMNDSDYKAVSERVVQVRKMLHGLLRRIIALPRS